MRENNSFDISIKGVKAAYKANTLTPRQLVQRIHKQAEKLKHNNIWIHFLSLEELEQYLLNLQKKSPDDHPLWGIPFAIKDNIDLAGVPTTAGCEDFSYMPDGHAKVVENLIEAGAIPIGKTNLDQFATGLNGTRSPYGICKNSFDKDFISGGSSSGSAVAVACGLVSFSLGTDTAGSGRVPAAFNNIVGLKPSLGLLSSTGLVPACRSLDTISIFAFNTDEANIVFQVAEGYDKADPYSRKNPFRNSSRCYGTSEGDERLAIIPPSQLRFFDDQTYAKAYQDTLTILKRRGFSFVEIDYQPFLEVAELLYDGPWISERYIAIQALIEHRPQAMLDVIREIISKGKEPSAIDLFKAQYRLKELRKDCLSQLQDVDALLTPTAGGLFTIEKLLQEPIRLNSQLGHYTNFMNLLDMCAVSIPTAITQNGLPFGITLSADHFNDRKLLSIGNRIQQVINLPMGATAMPLSISAVDPVKLSDTIELLVCGAHLSGMPLNWQLLERGAELSEKTLTACAYQLHALADGVRPMLVRDEHLGCQIEVEIWRMPVNEFGGFVDSIAAPLGIGKVETADGRWVCGFIGEAYGLDKATNISEYGGWKRWLNDNPTART